MNRQIQDDALYNDRFEEEEKKAELEKKTERIEKMKKKRQEELKYDERIERDYETAYRWKEKY